jgi:LmbE family N-acetylglucosaminyl deacetylase
MDKVLVIAPHADDAEFGMGGYIRRMIREGTGEPTVGIIAGGDYVDRFGELVTGEARLEETIKAMSILGVRSHCTLAAAPENKFDLVGQAVLITAVDTLLEMDSYNEVFICMPSRNQDHVALHAATLAAFRPGRWDRVSRLWGYEHPGNSAGPVQPLVGRCHVRLPLQDMTTKLRALEAHATQFSGKVKGHDGPEGATALAVLRGSECGGDFAELFWLLREIY